MDIKEILLEVRQHLCNTEFAPDPFKEPVEPDFPDKFIAQLHALIDEEVRKIFKVYDKYVKALGDEIDEMSGLMYAHGWRSSRVELGKKCRKEIAALKSKYLGEK